MGKNNGYWTIPTYGYPDTQGDYTYHQTRATITPLDMGYIDNPGLFVYDGSRQPWTEEDPYPDYVVEWGPRGGIRWERA